MLVFNEDRMVRARFNRSFIILGDGYGIASCASDNDDTPMDEFEEVNEGQECWVISDIFAEDYNDYARLFVYIPSMDYATTVLSIYISM